VKVLIAAAPVGSVDGDIDGSAVPVNEVSAKLTGDREALRFGRFMRQGNAKITRRAGGILFRVSGFA
jgi:hypothetical protein